MKLQSIQPNYSNRANVINQKITFTSNEISDNRAPFMPETIDMVNNLYDRYKLSLNETSFNEIRTTATEVSTEMQIPRKDVLKAMQLLTQYSNMRGLKTLGQKLEKENLRVLGNINKDLFFSCVSAGMEKDTASKVCDDSGINSSFVYLFNTKKFNPVTKDTNKYTAVILDDEKITQLETVKKDDPEGFDRLLKDKSLKFLYISGWDTGIPIVDRTKDLKEKTVELLKTSKENNISLEEALDYSLTSRIKNLGISAKVLKNEAEANEITVYNQMRPEQMNRNQLFEMIEANTVSKIDPNTSLANKVRYNNFVAKYLNTTLDVCTPERMSKDLKELHSKVEEYASKQNRRIVYVTPGWKSKSVDYINYCYKKVNKLPASKFTRLEDISYYEKQYPENKLGKDSLLVVLDDCSLTGNSISSIMNYNVRVSGVDSDVPVLFACLNGSQKANRNIENGTRHLLHTIFLNELTPKNLDWDSMEGYLVGKPFYKEDSYSLVFPYMAPDNNSEIGTSIALLHHPKYNSQNFSTKSARTYVMSDDMLYFEQKEKDRLNAEKEKKDSYCSGIKNLSDNIRRNSAKYVNLIGYTPIVYDKPVGNPDYVYDPCQEDFEFFNF